ncbi:hypothetical protein SOVF_082630, partial [Spinacia oleracea]
MDLTNFVARSCDKVKLCWCGVEHVGLGLGAMDLVGEVKVEIVVVVRRSGSRRVRTEEERQG